VDKPYHYFSDRFQPILTKLAHFVVIGCVLLKFPAIMRHFFHVTHFMKRVIAVARAANAQVFTSNKFAQEAL
jgi:hypothetical protein